MRLSVIKTDPGYALNTHPVTVFLDGKQVNYCVTADEEKGEVVVHKMGANNQPYFDAKKKEFVYETLTGQVEIRRPEGWEPIR